VSWDAREAVPRSLSGRLTAPSDEPPERITLDFLSAHGDLFRISDPASEFGPPAVERDVRNTTHVRIAQVHRGLPVFGGEMRVHVDGSGVVTSLEAEWLPEPLVAEAPSLPAHQAVRAAAADLDPASSSLSRPQLVIFDSGRFTLGPRDERLAWRVALWSAGEGEWIYFVDAETGALAFKYRETREALDREVRQINLAAPPCSLGGTLYYDETGAVHPDPPADATAAYLLTAEFYDYYLQTHGRDGYDGAGGRMVSLVEDSTNNAFWSSTCQRARFGHSFTVRDVVAHEWQHAVTWFTAGLTAACQPGALDESLSDVFAAMVDRDDWFIGEEVPLNVSVRSLADPTASSDAQPDTNAGVNPCAEVHENSGIPNKVAYLVSEGGLHYGVAVAGLGREATESIWYRALRHHMGPATDFEGARAATVNAAAELYGAGSPAVCSVRNAWASVAVGDPCPAAADDAAFVAQSVPETMVTGGTFSVAVTLRNTGTATWTSAAGYRLRSQNPSGNQTWGLQEVPLPGAVPQGEEVTFTFDVTSPVTAGSYAFQWRMVHGGVEFGAPSPDVTVSVEPPFDDAAFVLMSPPPPATMRTGQTALVNVTMRNTGTTTWTTATGYKLGSQSPQDNTIWGFHRVPLSGPVDAGEETTFQFAFTAPSTPGTYGFQWRMLREGVAWFGAPTPHIVITVQKDAAAFSWQSVPNNMVAGRPYTVSVRMRNVGSTTWMPAAGHRLGSQNPQDNQTWGLHRVLLPGPVAPGGWATFDFTVVAPSGPGTYNFRWRMVREGVAWFGAETPNVAVNVQPLAAPSNLVAVYDAAAVRIRLSWADNSSNEDGFHAQFSYAGSGWSDLVPPTVAANVTTWQSAPNPPSGSYQFRVRALGGGAVSSWSNVAPLTFTAAPPFDDAAFAWQSVPAVMTAGQQYVASVTMYNAGTTTWTAAAGHRLGSQNPQDNQIWGLGRVLLPWDVPPGGLATFSFFVDAPATPGTYGFQWRMLREGVSWFGAFTPNVAVVVQ
jgi:Zn-dependent metalloprotease